jgi:hypothetical protein
MATSIDCKSQTKYKIWILGEQITSIFEFLLPILRGMEKEKKKKKKKVYSPCTHFVYASFLCTIDFELR